MKATNMMQGGAVVIDEQMEQIRILNLMKDQGYNVGSYLDIDPQWFISFPLRIELLRNSNNRDRILFMENVSLLLGYLDTCPQIHKRKVKFIFNRALEVRSGLILNCKPEYMIPHAASVLVAIAKLGGTVLDPDTRACFNDLRDVMIRIIKHYSV